MTDLEARLQAATGSDRALDAELARLLDPALADPPPDYTASVDRAVELLKALLPGWSWHVGWDANGVLPYATLHHGAASAIRNL